MGHRTAFRLIVAHAIFPIVLASTVAFCFAILDSPGIRYTEISSGKQGGHKLGVSVWFSKFPSTDNDLNSLVDNIADHSILIEAVSVCSYGLPWPWLERIDIHSGQPLKPGQVRLHPQYLDRQWLKARPLTWTLDFRNAIKSIALIASFVAIAKLLFNRAVLFRQRCRKRHLLCEYCGYDMKSISTPRCPECGSRQVND